MRKALKVLNDLCIVVADYINDTEKVDKALFLCLFPFSNRSSHISTIKQVAEIYYDKMFKQQWTIDTIQNKVINRTKELMTSIENCIDGNVVQAYLGIRNVVVKLDEMEKQNSLSRARLIYDNRGYREHFDFDSYRQIRAVSRLEEMVEVKDFRTKQLLLKYKVVKFLEDIANVILQSLVRADVIYNMNSVEYLNPNQCLETFNSIRVYCSKDFIPEQIYLFDDKAKILKDYCEKNKQRRAQLLLDNVYNDLRLRQLDKQDVCAIIYLLFEKRYELGFKKGVLDKFAQFKEKIYEYYRLTPSTYKKNQIADRADIFRDKECILAI